MKRILLLCAFIGMMIAWPNLCAQAQVGVNDDNSAPDGTSMLDVKSTTRGMLIPRMTIAQRNAIASPATGLMVFCTDNSQYYYNAGTPASRNWVMMNTQWLNNGTSLYYNNGNVGIGTTNPGQKLSVAGQLGLFETGLSPTYFTTLQSGDLSGPVTFTLPVSHGTFGQLLTTDGMGNMYWSSGELPLTFTNGLTRSFETVKLGGALTETTTITQSGSIGLNFVNYGTENIDFNLIGMGEFNVRTGEFNILTVADYGCVGIRNTSPLYALDVIGDIRHFNNSGTANGIISTGSTSYAQVYVRNDYPGDTWGLSAGCDSYSAEINSYGINGWNNGLGYGVYGKSENGTGVYGINAYHTNYGSLGSNSYGVYGIYEGTNYGYLGGIAAGAYGSFSAYGNYGYLGSSNYGVYGIHAVSNNYGYIGGAAEGVYGSLGSTNPGNYAIYGYGVQSNGINGTGYSTGGTLGGVKGYNYYGNNYTFGVAGYSDLDYYRSGGAFGGFSGGTFWGSLGYRNSSNTVYGGYFTTYTSGTGKSSGVMINSGIGAWGDLFGADIHGKVYGLYVEGSDFGSYTNGVVFKNNLDVHLQKEQDGRNVALYTHVSTDATIQTCGYATLASGSCRVDFDPSFAAAVSASYPIIVTVTPMGKTEGVYLSEVTPAGFSIAENHDGKSSVQVSYIAIGKRAGYENPVLPEAVVSGDYVEKVSAGLHNDADTQTNGQGLYYEDGKLLVGIHPSTLPDPNKPAADPNLRHPEQPPKPEIRKPEDRGDGRAPGISH